MMLRRSRGRAWRRAGVVVSGVLIGGVVFASERPLRATTHAYPDTPVVLKQLKVMMTETFSTPTQFWTPDGRTRGSRVRYANRAGLSPSTFVLHAEVDCGNTSAQPIEALAVTIVLLDAFHQPVQAQASQQATEQQQLLISIPPRQSRHLSWDLPLRSGDIYEVAIIPTRVRFSNGQVWTAPQEELIDVF